MGKIWTWLTDRNWKTWAGHGLWGVAAGGAALVTDPGLARLPFSWSENHSLIAFVFWFGSLTGAFSFREMSDAFAHGMEDAKGEGLVAQLKATWRSFAEDGYFDLVSPYVGFGILVIFKGDWTFWGLGIFLVGSAAFILGHRVFKKRWPWEGLD